MRAVGKHYPLGADLCPPCFSPSLEVAVWNISLRRATRPLQVQSQELRTDRNRQPKREGEDGAWSVNLSGLCRSRGQTSVGSLWVKLERTETSLLPWKACSLFNTPRRSWNGCSFSPWRRGQNSVLRSPSQSPSPCLLHAPLPSQGGPLRWARRNSASVSRWRFPNFLVPCIVFCSLITFLCYFANEFSGSFFIITLCQKAVRRGWRWIKTKTKPPIFFCLCLTFYLASLPCMSPKRLRNLNSPISADES